MFDNPDLQALYSTHKLDDHGSEVFEKKRCSGKYLDLGGIKLAADPECTQNKEDLHHVYVLTSTGRLPKPWE
jgi:hypothetical protein